MWVIFKNTVLTFASIKTQLGYFYTSKTRYFIFVYSIAKAKSLFYGFAVTIQEWFVSSNYSLFQVRDVHLFGVN